MRKKKFYLIGIAGVAMASLAGLLKKKGYEVVGSDQEMYEPMKGMLSNLKIPVFTPYKAFHVKREKPDIVVVGNAIGRGNPELEYVISNRQCYRSMSDILQEEFIDSTSGEKKAIVITGTHGKTTTTALIAWILECAGLDPTVFIGGLAKNFNSSFKLGNGEYIVLEGDEYDTAFFDKGPKFWHYRPFVGVVNNIEWDHVDIYKDFDAYKFAFERFINLVPQNGLLVANAEDKNVLEIIKKAQARFHMKQFGLKRGDYISSGIKNFKTNLIGKYNASNTLAAVAVAKFLGISVFHMKHAIETFQGVKRRAEIIGEKHRITVIDDYAHHPTSVRETLQALKLKYSVKLKNKAKRRIFAIFEPGSASSKRRIFEDEYIKSFKLADLVYIYKPFKPGKLKISQLFHGKQVARKLNKTGVPAKSFDNIDKLLFHLKRDKREGDVIVIMSCRGFDNLYQKIWDVL